MLGTARRPSRRFALRSFLLLLPVLLVALAACAGQPEPGRDVAQVSTYAALEKGLYDGDTTYAQLAGMGDFGLGTFDGMDGEMVALDGRFYQARVDGSVRTATRTQETPFATVTFFKPDRTLPLAGPVASYDDLKAYLAQVAPPANRPYAFRIDGVFPALKIRSVPKQSEPYPPLADVVAQQVVWDLKDVRGSLVGYWFPQHLAGINAPGYHFHFISDDRQVAGHVLDASIAGGTLAIDELDQLTVDLPHTAAFATADLSPKP